MKPKTLEETNTEPDGHDVSAAQKESEDEYPLKVSQDLYTSKMEYSISDHKPVVGIFRIEVIMTSLYLI